ncbi:MAG: hydrogen gas-evolving membrane-bound hydrogenase subunit E [Verrucomicrobiota bacterium]
MGILLLIAVFAPLVGMLALVAFQHWTRRAPGWAALPFPLISIGCIIPVALSNPSFGQRVFSLPWIPSLSLDLSLLADGLSIFFGLVVSGMGVLIVFYAIHYFGREAKNQLRFFCYLLIFMTAMLGTVFAGNLLLLFVFWEITGISSFLLIGFLHEKEESRAGARMALLTTVLTGLGLLAGVVCLYLATGTMSLTELMTTDISELPQGLLLGAFFLIMLGAFGKSAQFPFHFWLPNAMAAPTPVSAYLHSATMVKLGVFLVARTFPIFNGMDYWNSLLMLVGFTTFLLAAVLALLSNKLKAILAYSTVSQLGFLVGFYGIADHKGTHFDYVHILNHVFYKGCLFMVVGIIDHATHIKDIRQLGGLGKRLPLLAIITLISAAAMAGLPFTTGFISKEYMLKEKFLYWLSDGFLNWFPLTVVIVGSVLKVAFSARLFFNIYRGSETPEVRAHFHHPGFWVQLPPLLLAGAAVVFGTFPALLDPFIDKLYVEGLHSHYKGNPDYVLSKWHGWTREFFTSLGIVLLGAGLYVWANRRRWSFTRIPVWLQFDAAFERGVSALPVVSKRITGWLRSDAPMDYLPIIGGFVVVCTSWMFLGALSGGEAIWPSLAGMDLLHWLLVLLLGMSALGVVVAPSWPAQVVALSIVGLLVTFFFVLMRAPDLAMTQLLIEATTLILILLLLARFPKRAQEGENQTRDHWPRKTLNTLLATATGLLMAALTFVFAAQKHPDFAGQFFLDNTVKGAKGTNTVNTILVDFRGFDTLMEITVLLIATLGCIGLLMRYRRTPDETAAAEAGPPGFGTKNALKSQNSEFRSQNSEN